MNNLSNITGDAPTTMTSIEIAERCGKRHDNVMADIKTMFDALDLNLLTFQEIYRDGRNREQKCFRLPPDLIMTLITGYSIPLRKKVIDRLDELQRNVASPQAALNDPAQLRHLLLENVDKVLNLQAEVAELSPLAKSYDLLTRADGTMCVTDVAKVLDLRPKDLFTWLQAHKWIYRRAGNGHWVGYQNRIQAGLLDHRVQEVTRSDGVSSITEQVRVTAKGLAKLGEHFAPAEKLAGPEEDDGMGDIPVVARLRRFQASA